MDSSEKYLAALALIISCNLRFPQITGGYNDVRMIETIISRLLDYLIGWTSLLTSPTACAHRLTAEITSRLRGFEKCQEMGEIGEGKEFTIDPFMIGVCQRSCSTGQDLIRDLPDPEAERLYGLELEKCQLCKQAMDWYLLADALQLLHIARQLIENDAEEAARDTNLHQQLEDISLTQTILEIAYETKDEDVLAALEGGASPTQRLKDLLFTVSWSETVPKFDKQDWSWFHQLLNSYRKFNA